MLRTIIKNHALKALSLGLAILLSLFVHYSFVTENAPSSMVQLIVPVEVQNLSRDQIITWPPTRQAEVALRGSSNSLSRIVTSPPIFRVEVPEGTQHRFVAQLRKEDLRVSADVEILSIRPSDIEFKLDTLVRRTVPVVVPRIGSVAEGLVIERIDVEPEEVVLRGPESELKTIGAVETLPLDVREIAASQVQTLSVRVPGSLTESETSSVEISVKVGVKAREALFRNVPIEVRTSSGAMLKVVPSSVVIEVSGPEKLVTQMPVGQILPYVRVREGEEVFTPFEREVKVEVPEHVSVIRIDPPSVRVVQSKVPAAVPGAKGKARGAVSGGSAAPRAKSSSNDSPRASISHAAVSKGAIARGPLSKGIVPKEALPGGALEEDIVGRGAAGGVVGGLNKSLFPQHSPASLETGK